MWNILALGGKEMEWRKKKKIKEVEEKEAHECPAEFINESLI